MRAKCATVDEAERIRAARAEVARLSTLRYREKLTSEQQAIAQTQISELAATLPEADRTSWSEDQVYTPGIELDWSILAVRRWNMSFSSFLVPGQSTAVFRMSLRVRTLVADGSATIDFASGDFAVTSPWVLVNVVS